MAVRRQTSPACGRSWTAGRGGGGGGRGAGAGGVLLRGDLLLRQEFGLVALVLASGLVRVLGGPVAVALGELLLELARVEQHQRGQFDRAPGGVDGAVEALGHDVRDEAAVVQMGVGQDDRVKAGRVVGEGNSVAHLLVRPALKHAAVDEHLGPLGDEQELGSGDGVGSAEEVDFHARILTPQWPARGSGSPTAVPPRRLGLGGRSASPTSPVGAGPSCRAARKPTICCRLVGAGVPPGEHREEAMSWGGGGPAPCSPAERFSGLRDRRVSPGLDRRAVWLVSWEECGDGLGLFCPGRRVGVDWLGPCR